MPRLFFSKTSEPQVSRLGTQAKVDKIRTIVHIRTKPLGFILKKFIIGFEI